MKASWIDEIRSRLNRPWPERQLLAEEKPDEGPAGEAAVLVPLYVRDRQLFTLFTRNAGPAAARKGPVSFPGGAKGPRDETLWHTAIRETEEGTGVPRTSVRLIGALPRLVTVTNFAVAPFVGAIPYPLTLRPASAGVEGILEVPISYLLNPTVVEEREVTFHGKPVTTPMYHYGRYTIWGATAYILGDLLTLLSADDSGETAAP